MDPVRVSAKAVIVENDRLLTLRLAGRDPRGNAAAGVSRGNRGHGKPGAVLWIRDYREINQEFRDVRPDFHQLEIMFQCALLNEPDMDTRQVRLLWIPLDEIEGGRSARRRCDRCSPQASRTPALRILAT